jgi:hypothetical protein
MIRFHVTLIQSCRLNLPVISCRIYIVVIGDKTVLFKEYFRARKLPEKVRSEREVLPDKNLSVFLVKFPGSATASFHDGNIVIRMAGCPIFFLGTPRPCWSQRIFLPEPGPEYGVCTHFPHNPIPFPDSGHCHHSRMILLSPIPSLVQTYEKTRCLYQCLGGRVFCRAER